MSDARPRKWEVEFFFDLPHPESPIIEDVCNALHRRERSRQPLRHLADCIIRDRSTEHIVGLLTAGQNEHYDIDMDEPISKGLRLLHFAVFQHNEDVVSYLLEHGADPNLMDDVGYTPLHICAEKGYTDLIPLLLRYGARLRFTDVHPGDPSFGDPPRATAADEPLRLAIRNREYPTASLLLQRGADPNASYYLGREINLVDPVDLPSIELLLHFGADPDSRDLQGLTPLMKACRNPEAVDAVYLLISYGADVNATTEEEKRTPLHYAVLTGNLELVHFLIEHGARTRFLQSYPNPPPHYFAVLKGDIPILRYLLGAGADVNAESTVVGSALHIALTEKIRNKEAVVRTLLESGANPNAITVSDKGPMLKTPIGEYIHSCEHPQLQLVHLLLRYGARIVLLGQRQHPFGIIKVIHRLHLGLNPEVMNLVVEASEAFCVSFIQNSIQMSDDHKQLLLNRALQPFSLKHIARLQLRRYLGWGPRFVSIVLSLSIPQMLKEYIFFQT